MTKQDRQRCREGAQKARELAELFAHLARADPGSKLAHKRWAYEAKLHACVLAGMGGEKEPSQ